MKRISEKEAIRLLKRHADSEEDFKGVLRHSKAVQKLALNIGRKVKDVDLDFIKTASLLHDIGRFRCKPGSKEGVRHGICGAGILRKEGLRDYALVAERHLGPGISKEDIAEQGLDLPLKDYIPISNEEKIITHADNLISDYKRISVEGAAERFSKEISKKTGKRVKKLAEEVEGMRVRKLQI